MELKAFLEEAVQQPLIHAKWLNTLSYLENCGARMIARCEHPTMVPEEMLKHAAEEFRHAFYLKKQIQAIWPKGLENYSQGLLLGGHLARQYLARLNLQICRYLKSLGIRGDRFKEQAYVLVTYAIEKRAEVLYPLYQELLEAYKLPVSVKGIIREEEQHLKEMQEELDQLEHGAERGEVVCAMEQKLFHKLDFSCA